jgi:hypothetical protein
MGNNKMDDTLMLMVYADSTGKNVTVSPRLSYGHTEPSYTKNVTIAVQPGSGISNGNMTVNAICSNCRSWKGGSIDPTNPTAKFIFAIGPDGSINSNSESANIKRHSTYGAFTMDLTKAVGAAQIPIIATSDSSGTIQTQDQTDHDFSPRNQHISLFPILSSLSCWPAPSFSSRLAPGSLSLTKI